VHEGLQIEEEYQKSIGFIFDTTLQNVNFLDPKTVQLINEDTPKATDGRINQIVDSGTVESKTG
jgi:serine protease inhibitor